MGVKTLQAAWNCDHISRALLCCLISVEEWIEWQFRVEMAMDEIMATYRLIAEWDEGLNNETDTF